MSAASVWEKRAECPRCGNFYLPPWRDGAFRCGACGATLPTHRRSPLVPLSVAVVMAVATLIGLLVVAAPRAPRRPADIGPTAAAIAMGERQARMRGLQQYMLRQQRDQNLWELQRNPNQSIVHTIEATRIYREARHRAMARMAPSTAPPGGDQFSPPAASAEKGERQIERLISNSFQPRVQSGLQHAETALRLARNANEELAARAVRAEGLRLGGQYRRAMAEYAWLDAVDPWPYAVRYARCYQHLNLPVPDRLQRAMEPLPTRIVRVTRTMRRPLSRIEMLTLYRERRRERRQSLQRVLAGNTRLAERWPKDAVPQVRLADLCFRLARVSAELEASTLQLAPPTDVDARLDELAYQRHRKLVERGLNCCRRALSLTPQTEIRVAALQATARGLLFQGKPDEAIATIKKAARLAPDGPNPTGLLNTALHRRARQRGPLLSQR